MGGPSRFNGCWKVGVGRLALVSLKKKKKKYT